jgi:hypothetical protein
LVYEITVTDFKESEIDAINVTTRNLSIKLRHSLYRWGDTRNEALHRRLPYFLKHLAGLGHFEVLKISFWYSQVLELDRLEGIADALVAVMKGNPNLSCLNLIDLKFDIYDSHGLCLEDSRWSSQRKKISKAMEEHHRLETIVLKRFPVTEDPYYSWLKRLLWRNRFITVLDSSGNRCSDGNTI